MSTKKSGERESRTPGKRTAKKPVTKAPRKVRRSEGQLTDDELGRVAGAGLRRRDPGS